MRPFHDGRHTSITNAAAAGTPPAALMARAGHSDDSKIDELLGSPNVGLLRRFRHGVFHFHEDYFNEHLTTPFVDPGEERVLWVRSVSNEYGQWFLEWFRGRGY
jgi:hypothetical protein